MFSKSLLSKPFQQFLRGIAELTYFRLNFFTIFIQWWSYLQMQHPFFPPADYILWGLEVGVPQPVGKWVLYLMLCSFIQFSQNPGSPRLTFRGPWVFYKNFKFMFPFILGNTLKTFLMEYILDQLNGHLLTAIPSGGRACPFGSLRHLKFRTSVYPLPLGPFPGHRLSIHLRQKPECYPWHHLLPHLIYLNPLLSSTDFLK